MSEPGDGVRQTWVIQLVQACQGQLETTYLPYSIGLLQAYVLRHAPDLRPYTFLPLLADRLPLKEAWARMQLADIYGFSTYIWNIEYSLALARQIKQRKPQALIIFGGPQVPDQAEAFLAANPFVDVCVHGEGERVFLQWLESLPGRDWSGIPGISWRDSEGHFCYQPPAPRLQNLEEIPSPYLMGLFDPLLARADHKWVPLWETNRGCPFTCTFCDWGSAVASKVQRFELSRLLREIDWFAAHKLEIINCCDANFGILPRDLEIADYVVETHQRTGYPRSFFMQGAKNVTERAYAVQKRIVGAGLHFMVTLSLQSVSPQALKNIRRENISLDTFRQLQQRFRQDGVETYTDLLIGLPGETYDSFVDGICRVLSEGQHHWLSFYSVFLLPNAEMAQAEYRQRFGLQTVSIPYSEAWLPLQQIVPEYLEMVTATDSFTVDDWCRMRTFAWWVQILYYHYRLLQLPLLLLNQLGGLPWRQVFEFFAGAHFSNTPMLQDLHHFIANKARAMTLGEPEHCALTQVQDPRWVVLPKYIATGLTPEPVTRAFFYEISLALTQLQQRYQLELPPGLLHESLALSEAIFVCQAQQKTFALSGEYNLWEWYQQLLHGEPVALRREPCRYVRDWLSEPMFDVRVESRR